MKKASNIYTTTTLGKTMSNLDELMKTAPEVLPTDPPPQGKGFLTSRQRGNLTNGRYPRRHINNLDKGLFGEGHHKYNLPLEERFSDKTSEKYIPDALVFLFGDHGGGTTQCATYLARNYLRPQYMVAKEYLTELLHLQKGFYTDEQRGPLLRLHREYKECDFLTIEEITQTVSSTGLPTENTFQELTNLIDHRYRHELPTIILGNCIESEVGKYLSSNVLDRINETGGLIETTQISYRN